VRLLWVTERFPPDRGGASVSAARQVKALAPHVERIDVVRLTGDEDGGRVRLTQGDGFQLFEVGRADAHEESLQLLTQTCLNLIDAQQHTIVQGFFAVHAGFVAAWCARLRSLPSVVSLRGNDLDRALFHGPRLAPLLWTLDHATALTGVSREILDRASALADRAEGLHVVRNAVDAEVFGPGAADAAPPSLAGAPRPWIGFSGEMRLKKGLPVLQDLAETLATRDTGTLVLVGGVRDDSREAFRAWQRARPAAATRVRETSYLDDPRALAAIYRALDVVVLPSLWDGLPNAALEAMACARPVVAAAVGGLGELIDDGVTGWLVPPSRLDGFASAVLRVLDLPDSTREAVGRAARDHVIARHGGRQETDALLHVYASVGR
jgi:phosphatidylinositol alpha-1,6-mannosyltransferase